MKKVLITLGLVALMSMSCFAVSLELMNVLGNTTGGNFPIGGVGVGFNAGPAEVIVSIAQLTAAGSYSNNDGMIISAKGIMPVYGALNMGLQIDMIPDTLVGTAATQMTLTVGVKKTLVSGVDLRIEGIVYATDGAAGTPMSSMLNGGATVGISCPIM